MDTMKEKDRKNQDFYKKFSVDIINKVRETAVLDLLHHKGVLSKEQRYETIKDLTTAENRRKLCSILETTDYKNVAILVGILEDVSGTAQSDLVHEMKKHLSDTDPVLAQTYGLAVKNEASVAPGSASASGPAESDSDYSFTVTRSMVTPITDFISNNDLAIQYWPRVYPKIATHATDKMKIQKLLKDVDTLHEAIQYTMQLWASQRRGTFQELLNLFEKDLLTDLAQELKDNYLSIKNAK